MNLQTHENLKSTIWEIANRLRGPYRPPQYRLVMLPIVVLRRLDCVLEPTKHAVLKEHAKLTAQKKPESAMDNLLSKAADPKRKKQGSTIPARSPFSGCSATPRTSRPTSFPTSTDFPPPRGLSSSASNLPTRSKSSTPATGFSPSSRRWPM
ncbi:type I restriction-modification system subunit M N-terminal domain-containing protein [Mesorhizobium escarrei]|uniref:Site-specific DNA-methyltransferase (Adenine-specific) n=1 Tax=Mesorhizobium escarrei TaxID=666018 RepID=A0ABN8KK17_9HYPH|nr:putative Site-specific DNA-methyltransferase (adenine-specific) [Mesorhizobium escarrei]